MLDAGTLDGISEARVDDVGVQRSPTKAVRTLSDIIGVDQIFHHGDTNTYIQFHAADQFRVVTGGTERVEVNNSRTQIDRSSW